MKILNQKFFKNIKFTAEISSYQLNDILGTNVYNALESCL